MRHLLYFAVGLAMIALAVLSSLAAIYMIKHQEAVDAAFEYAMPLIFGPLIIYYMGRTVVTAARGGRE